MPMEKTFNAAKAEARIYAAWESSGAFRAGAGKRREETFTIMIPPPNVTGALHVGHAFNNTLQDILVRWHRMRGFDTLWQPGQDHAGIATQLQVEKMLAAQGNLGRREMGRDKFLEKVWEWKGQYGQTIIDQLKRLGSSCDWSRNAFTMAGAPGDPRLGHENSANFHDAVIKVFVEMYEKGLIYRGKRIVNWDPHFETAISDLEVENIEEPGHMWHFKYPLAGGATYEYLEKDDDGNVTLCETRDYIAIATTRPETILGDGAVAVHPSDDRYGPIVGALCEIPVGPKEHRRLIPIITDDYPDPTFGSGAVKITGAHDFNDYAVAKRGGIPMYRLMDTCGAMRDDGAPYADAATRAQAIAEGADWDGAEVDTLNLVPDDLRGLDRFAAREKVIDQITAEGLAVMVPNPDLDPDAAPLSRGRGDGGEAAKNRGEAADAPAMIPLVDAKPIIKPYGDRSKVVIEPMLTDQWFVDTAKIVGPALNAVRDGDVKIMPTSGEKTYFHWLENIEPWCISRQLWWGHQVPVWNAMVPAKDGSVGTWRVSTGGNLSLDQQARFMRENQYDEEALGGRLTKGGLLTQEFCAASAEEAKHQISKVWQERKGVIPEKLVEVDSEPNEWPQDSDVGDGYFQIPFWRDPDVLDTWFSSGLWPIGTLGWPEDTEELKKYFPSSVLITGQDILFFWVARMIMMQLAVVREVPFHTVYLHQLVRDGQGKKMSKTAGNVIDPLEIIDQYGADALRFTNATMAAIGGVLKLSEDRIKGYRNFGTKLWNAARFAEMNGAYAGGAPVHFRPDAHVKATVNKWIIGEVGRARESVDAALSAYRFNDAANGLYAFVWGTVCDWYLEFSKPLFTSEDAGIVEETRATMAWIIDQCLILLHPFMPFITEELWGTLADRDNMLVLEPWPEHQPAEFVDENASAEMQWVIALIEEIRSIRGEMGVPAGANIPMIKQELDPEGEAALSANQPLITRLARISDITPGEAPKGAVIVAVRGGTFALPLAELIDITAEKARLEKTQDRLSKEIGGLSGRLKNPKFAAAAPPEVVQETRENLSLREEEAAKIASALTRLADMR